MIQENSISTFAMKRRAKRNSSPQSIFKRLRRQARFYLHGDYYLAKGILEGCLDSGKVSAREYEDLMKLLPNRDVDDTRNAISQNFRDRISKKHVPYEI